MKPWEAVRLVAGREIRERLKSRAFRISTLISALVVGGVIVVPNLGNDAAPVYDVALVGTAPAGLERAIESTGVAVGGNVNARHVASTRAAERGLRDGAFDVAVVEARELVVDDPIDPARVSGRLRLVAAVSEAVRLQTAIEQSGLDADAAARALAPRQLPIRALGKPAQSETEQFGAFLGVVVLFLFLQQYGGWILVGVAEEKSSRIAEVLLAAVRPRQLVAGKVLGIGTVGLIQATIVAVTAVVALRSVGENVVEGIGPADALTALGWFLLGFAFYGWAYAAAGSLVSRQSEAQAAGFPVTIPLLASYIAASMSWASAEPSTVLRVLAYLPPTAPLCMPTLISKGEASPAGVVLAVVGTIVGAVFVSRVAGAVYSNAILRTGKKVKWLEALRSA